ncbi:MAG: hypothetical protein VX766_15320 [Pseudomonadota bacterium]|nr:hypothetical protein [Pseudomonadota bacterium]
MTDRDTDPERIEPPEKAFHLWRLLSVIGLVMLVLMGVAALVNILVLGF